MTATVPRPPSARPVLAKLRDRALKVAELVTTPLLPADYLDLVDPLRSGAALRGRIEAVQPETRDAVTVVIRPGRDWLPHTPASTSGSASTSTASGSGAPTRSPRCSAAPTAASRSR